MVNESVSVFHSSGEKPTVARADVWDQNVECMDPLPLLSFRAAAIPCFLLLCFCFCFVYPLRGFGIELKVA